jgi:hypothetical protein
MSQTLLPSLSGSRANILCRTTPLADYELLPLTPPVRYSECVPNIAPSTLQQVEPVSIARESEFESVVGVIASAMTINQPLKRPLDLKPLSAAQEGVR